MGIRMRLALGIAAVAAPAIAQQAPVEQAPMAIYGHDALADGWSNWSWAKTVPGAEMPGAPAGVKPIKVDAGPYAALYFQHAPFSTKGYKALSIAFHGGPTGGQQLSIMALSGGKIIPDKAFRIQLPPGNWGRVTIPLEALGAVDREIDGIWVQNPSDKPADTFWVAEVALK